MNYYEILGINQDASQSEIKQAYRRLTLKTHPDKNSGGSDIEFKKVTEAFDTLFNIEKRMNYDAFHFRNKNNNNMNMHFNKSSLIKGEQNQNQNVFEEKENSEDIFSNKKLNQNESQRQNYIEPIRKILLITLEESYNGCYSPLQIERRVGNNMFENELVYVNIAPGTDKGEIIELKGKGNIDKNGNCGDIRITIDIAPYEKNKFIRDKLDVIMNVEISLLQSLCGFTMDITHLDGKTYRINSSEGNVVQPNSKRIISKKGFTRGEISGNLIIVFNVIYPEKIKLENIQKLQTILNDL